MHAFSTLASLVFLASRLALVHASVYVTNPVQGNTCTGGQPCTVTWIDNGEAPLLASIGECDVGLYTGELTLAQSLLSVDVSSTSSLSFTPNPASGPNGQYYIVFTASSINYQGFSASFTLAGMSGTTPGGGSSTPVSALATTSAGSSTSADSSTPATSPTDTAAGSSVSTPSGTSSPAVGTTTPTDSSSAVDTTTATGTTSPTLTTPTVSVTASSATHTSASTTTASKTSSSPSTSATATGAAVRVGSSASLGGIAALLVLSGVLAF